MIVLFLTLICSSVDIESFCEMDCRTVAALLNQSAASGIQDPQIRAVISDYFTDLNSNEEELSSDTDSHSDIGKSHHNVPMAGAL